MRPQIVSKKFRQWIPLVLGIGLGVLVIMVAGPQVVSHKDSADYMAIAQALLRGEGYLREALLYPMADLRPLPHFRPPLYPFLIFVIWKFVPNSVIAIKLVQAILFGWTCLFLYHIGLAVFRNHKAAFIGSILYAVNPFALIQVTYILSESLHTFLIAGGLLFISRLVLSEKISKWDAIFGGVVFGLASLCRPTALPVGLTLGVGIIFLQRGSHSLGKLIQVAFLVIACIFLVILPWSISNLIATGEFFLITNTLGGYHFWYGTHPAFINYYKPYFGPQEKSLLDVPVYRLTRAKINEWEKTSGYWSLPLKEREKMWYRAAWTNIRNDPWLTLRLWIYKALAFWRPWLHPIGSPPLIVLLSGIVLLPLYLLAGVGAALIRSDIFGKRFLWLLAVLFITVTGIHALFHAEMRYRLPYVDPYLSVLAGPAVLAGIKRIVTHHRKKSK